MSSLHWILVLTLAFLYSAAYPTTTTQGIKHQRSLELRRFIGLLKNSSCIDNESKYYSASPGKEECIESALNCTLTELDKFPNECFDTVEDRNTILKRCKRANALTKDILANSLKKNTATSTDCNRCESYPEKTYKEFLDDFWNLIQQLNNM